MVMDIKGALTPLTAWKQLFKKPHTITVPYVKREAAQRYRGFHYNDLEKCVGCGSCSEICQNEAIDMVPVEGVEPNKGDSGLRPMIDYGRCCWCALCVDVCPTGSLQMSREYIWIRDNPEDFRFIPGKDYQEFMENPGYQSDPQYSLLDLQRVPMSELDPVERVEEKPWAEVVLGYTEEEARKEAQRCLGCGLCVSACPATMHIPDYIAAIAKGDYEEAVNLFYDTNPLPEMCGKVCTRQCEFVCTVGYKGEPVAIRWLKRFASEQFDDLKDIVSVEKGSPKGKKVGVIGAGPSGLTVGYYLAQKGYEVTIYEAFPKAGGMTMAGIPKYRFPWGSLDKQIELIESVGVKIVYNHKVTADEFKDLMEKYDAIFIGVGLMDAWNLDVPGDDHPQVISALKMLVDVNLGKKVEIGEKVVVVGGGNVAMDAARVSRRLGAEVIVSYRRRLVDMPADEEEIEEAKDEGIIFETQTIPSRIEPLENGKIRYVYWKAQMVDQGPGKRPKPVPIKEEEFYHDVDRVIVAIGQKGDYNFLPKEIVEKIVERGKIKIDSSTGMTSVEGLFAGGDAVNRVMDAISAIGDGLRAVKGIDKYLSQK